MSNKNDKPTPEAKALSLFLMAHKSTSNLHKERSKRLNKQWGLVQSGDLDMEGYHDIVKKMVEEFGGYEEVVAKTVKYFVAKTGAWKHEGDDQFSIDARAFAEKLNKK